MLLSFIIIELRFCSGMLWRKLSDRLNVALILGDELLSDSFPYKEIQNGVLWEVEGKVGVYDFLTLDLSLNT